MAHPLWKKETGEQHLGVNPMKGQYACTFNLVNTSFFNLLVVTGVVKVNPLTLIFAFKNQVL